LDGQISADGTGGTFGGGGGSGGSLWLTVGKLAGGGDILSDGGAGDWPGGGGGGGRIAIYYAANEFTGVVSAHGGYGLMFGGAGTIYSKAIGNPVGQVVVDNGGTSGTNTPLSSPEAFDLAITGGATVNPSGGELTFSSLLINSGANLTHLNTQSNLDVVVLGSANIGSDGSLAVNGEGFSGGNGGPGAGQMLVDGSGSGAGYGGPGGASASGAPGGGTYGSATQPIDRGSRGGLFSPANYPNFCQGGGAVRLRVGGTLTVNGKLTANGDDALYDSAGGGAGGSIWVTAGTFAGEGFVTANGGGGEPFNGGGGGGGRIAIDCQSNTFTGFLGAFGGYGASPGGNGTLVITNIAAPMIIAQSPTDIVSSVVSYVDLTFDSLMNSNSISASDFTLDTPNGFLPQSSLTVTALDLNTIRISFPPQDTSGYYEVQAGPFIEDIYGVPMSATYVDSFVILPPVISGYVTDANGLPVRFVTVRPAGGLSPDVTDANGFYSIEVLPSWTGTTTPSKGSALFIPGMRSYADLTSDRTNQNFIMVTSSALALNSQRQGAGLSLGWYGINGVSYQLLYSTDLVNWAPYGAPITGTNGQMTIIAPIDNTPEKFFRFTTSY
jgi:hypothetical protein